jgi:hypothetical protein
MRWLYEVFDRSGSDRPSDIYGLYPGVDIFDPQSKRRVGEADVLILMADGRLVPGECKRYSAGLVSHEIDKLETLENALDAPWSFVATLDMAEVCGPIWQSCQRSLPDRPRFALTGPQLFQQLVVRTLGSNPFTWGDVGIAPQRRLTERVRSLE